MKGIMKVMAFLGGSGLMGYMWLKKHPKDMEKLREKGRDMTRMIYHKLEDE